MVSKSMLFILGILWINFSWALETDQFSVWDRKLEDSSILLNQFINSEMELHLKNNVNSNIEKGKKYTCEQVKDELRGIFSWNVTKLTTRLEMWIWNNAEIDSYPKRPFSYFNRNHYSFYRRVMILRTAPLAPTINFKGIYFGIDKLAHFLNLGHSYYKSYWSTLMEGQGPQKALENAIWVGIRSEFGILGLKAGGVFSYADLEANYQGLRYFNRFCHTKDSYLIKDGKFWQLNGLVDLGDYINPKWDETFNLNYYRRRVLRKVYAPLRQLCPRSKDPLVQERLSFYKKNLRTSYSGHFINSLLEKKILPEPFSYCPKKSFGKKVIVK